MAARNATPLTWKAKGLSDAEDGTNAFPGAMQSLANLIPSPSTQQIWVPRPAAQTVANFGGSGASPIWGSFKWGAVNWGGFNSPAQINELLVVGNIAYGLVAETAGTFAGKDVPYVLNLATGAFFVVTIPGAASTLPTTPPITGDWTPPTMAQIAGRVMITHSGYPGGATKIGWIDVSGFSSNTLTGNTHSSTTIDGLSSNPITAGFQPGMTVSGNGVVSTPATTIVSLTATSITLNQATSSALNGIILTVAGGTATAPLYGSGDTNTNNLPAVPTCVSQFNGRAYYGFLTTAGVGVALVLSDAGNPTQITNATQALSFNNGLGVTALAGLPLSNQLGGVIGSLMAFQSDANIMQITGDPVNNNLATNSLNIAIGTLAPNTIASTPIGLAFIAPDGMRIIQFNAVITEPIGRNGSGVAVPFINAINPSRMTAAYNQNVYRVSCMNGAVNGQPTQEYWYDFGQRIWSGPHSFPAAQIAAWSSGSSNTFVMAASGINAKLWQSDVLPTGTSSYTENGSALACTWETVLLPDTDTMYENAVVESTLALQLPPQSSVLVQAMDEAGNLLGNVTLAGANTGATVWGAFNWGAPAVWGGSTGFFRKYPLNWPNTLVFNQMTVEATTNATSGLAIGNLTMRYQKLGYLMQNAGGRV